MANPLSARKPEGDPLSPRVQIALLFDAGCAGVLHAVDMPATAPVIGSRQVGKFLGDAVGGDIQAIAGNRAVARAITETGSRRAAEEVDAVARPCVGVDRTTDNPQCDIG